MSSLSKSSKSVRGFVHRVNVKGKTRNERGIPKHTVSEIDVNEHGFDGDYNRYRETKKAGDSDMAVLIIPLETLEALRSEGWPVEPGDLGENITTSGIDYGAFNSDLVLRIGNEVQLQISKVCDPCTNLYKLNYVGTQKGPAFLRTLLGRRGWYARVIRPGRIRPGDPIVF
jgi:MOSC domain-containing protein YiiM